jgi:hypothetical protein
MKFLKWLIEKQCRVSDVIIEVMRVLIDAVGVLIEFKRDQVQAVRVLW